MNNELSGIVLFKFPNLGALPEVFLLLVSNSVLLFNGRILSMVLNLFHFMEAILRTQNMIYLDKCSMCTWNTVIIRVLM